MKELYQAGQSRAGEDVISTILPFLKLENRVGSESMTQQWMLKTLSDLGFRQKDAEVYVFLAMNGSQKAKEITKALHTCERQVYRILKRLQQSQVVAATPKPPAQFSAIPFDRVLDSLMKANLKEAERIEEKKDKILSLWKSSIDNDSAG